MPRTARNSSPREQSAAFSLHLQRPSVLPTLPILSRRQAEHVLKDAHGSSAKRVAKPAAPTLLSTNDRTFNERSKVDFDGKSLVTTATSCAVVERSLEEVINLSDPRAWSHRAEIWLDSYAVQLDNGRVVFDGRGVPKADPEHNGRDKWGTPWQGVLYEVTDWHVSESARMGFDVLLDVSFNEIKNPRQDLVLGYGDGETPRDDARSFLYTFALNEALRGQLGYQVLDGGVEVDIGYAYAIECYYRGNAAVHVEAQKKVRYADWTPEAGDEGVFDAGQLLNYLAPGFLGVWIGSLVDDGLNADPNA